MEISDILAISSGFGYSVRPLIGSDADGETILISTVGDGDAIVRWDGRTGAEIWRYSEELPGCNGAVLTSIHDKQFIVSVATEDGVEAWNALGGDPWVAPELDDTIWAVSSGALQDGRQLIVAAGNNGQVFRWEALSSELLSPPLRGHDGPVMSVGVVRTLGQETIIVSGDERGLIRRWNASGGEKIGDPLAGHESPVFLISSFPLVGDRSLFASSDAEGVIRCWDAIVGAPVGAPLVIGEEIYSLATTWVGGTPYLLAAAASERVYVSNATTGEFLETSLCGISVATLDQPDGSVLVATGAKNGYIRLQSMAR